MMTFEESMELAKGIDNMDRMHAAQIIQHQFNRKLVEALTKLREKSEPGKPTEKGLPTHNLS